jgi:hypothetical protein
VSTEQRPPGDQAPPPNVEDRELYGDDMPGSTEMYPVSTALRPALQQRQNDLVDVLGLSREERVARHRAFVQTIRESGVDALRVGAPLYDALVSAEIAEKRGAPIDEAQAATIKEETRRALRSAYGADRAEQLDQAVGAFLAAHPRLQALLQTPGFVQQSGARKVILEIVDHVRRTKHL